MRDLGRVIVDFEYFAFGTEFKSCNLKYFTSQILDFLPGVRKNVWHNRGFESYIDRRLPEQVNFKDWYLNFDSFKN